MTNENLVWQQNRHQKVPIGELYSTFVQWGLTFWNLNQHHCCYSASYFDLGGVLELCFGEAKPTKGPPWWLDCVANFSLLFNPIDSEKYWGYAICQACRRRYVKVSVHKHDRDQSDATHSSVYSASRQNLCWDYFAVIWTQSVEVVIWQAWYAETIGWDLGVYG